MFIYSAKLNKKKLAAILIGAAAVILILIFVLARGGHSETDHDAQRDEQLKLLQSSRLETNEERLTLLTALGWDVSGQPAEEVEVRIPSEFSEVYEKYNLIQKEQGLNLEKHRGEKAMRYTYQIVNHPSGDTALMLVTEALMSELGRRTAPESTKNIEKIEQALNDNGLILWEN